MFQKSFQQQFGVHRAAEMLVQSRTLPLLGDGPTATTAYSQRTLFIQTMRAWCDQNTESNMGPVRESLSPLFNIEPVRLAPGVGWYREVLWCPILPGLGFWR